MITNIKFGECLKFLLSALDISTNRLSKAINVDSSLVNRWINGKRIPSYHTSYIENISEYLSKNIQNTFQEQRLGVLFLNVYESTEFAVSYKEKIKKVLLESQGYSIECKRKERKESKEQIYIKKPANNETDLAHSIALSSEDKIIFGIENILTACNILLKTALNQKIENNNTIYITYNNDVDMPNLPYDRLIDLRNTLFKVMNNGWEVLFLLRLNNNTDRTIKFINFIKPLIKTGRLNIYYCKKYGCSSTGRETIIIPEVGALSCFSSNLKSDIDCAFYLRNNAAVNVLKYNFNLLLVSSAQSLFKYYMHKNFTDYSNFFIENEESTGNRFLYKYSFSVLTVPEKLFVKLLKRKKLSKDEMFRELNFYKRRLTSFISNIHNYEYKDIYLTNSIEDLIKHRQYYLYCNSGIELVDLDIQDIIDHLQNIISLLERYDNYNIAFMPQNIDSYKKNVDFYCIVKERKAILLETFEISRSIPEVRLSIEEPMLVRAVDEYFKELWEHIAPVNKDKKEIISWMQNHINSLKRSNSPFSPFTPP